MINSSSGSVQAGSASDWHYLLPRRDRAPDSPLFPSDAETDTEKNERPYLRSSDAAAVPPLRPRAAAASARPFSGRVELFRSLPRSTSAPRSASSPSCRWAPPVRTSVLSPCARLLSPGRKVAATKSAERLFRSFPFVRESMPAFPGVSETGSRVDSAIVTADADGSAVGDGASSFAAGGVTEDSAITAPFAGDSFPETVDVAGSALGDGLAFVNAIAVGVGSRSAVPFNQPRSVKGVRERTIQLRRK